MSEQDAIQPTEEESLINALNDETRPPPEEDGLEEVDIGDKKLRVPKEVKEAWNGMQSKTQTEREAVAKERAAVAERSARVEEDFKTRSAFFKEVSEVESIDRDLAPYLKLTPAEWIAWAEQDSAAASKAQVAVNAMQMKRGQLVQSINQKAQEQQSKTRETTAQQRDQAERELAAKIPGWSAAKKAEVASFAKTRGFSSEEFEGVATDPRVISILAEVAEFQALKAKAKAAASKKPDEPPPEPSAKLPTAGNSGPTPLSDRQNMNDWTKQFLKDRAKHQNRR